MKVDFKKFLVALFLLFCLDLHIAKVFPDSGWDLEDMDFAEDISEAKMEELANSNATRAADGSSDSEAAAFLAAFVSEPLWEQTYSPRGRDALYLTPQMRNFKPRFFSTHLFYNETDRVNITVGDAFSLEFQSEEQRQQFFELLAKFVPGVPTDQTASDLAMLANLLQKIGVKERKAGGLFKGGFKIGRASFGVDFSIYLSERNLASDASTEEQIRQIIISNLSSGDSVPEIDLEAEFVRQRFGLGDTRLSLGVDAIRLTDFKSTIGVSAIVPTAVGVLLDGHFRKPSEPQLEGFGIPIRDMRCIT